MLRDIVELGDPVLRQKASPVNCQDPQLKNLITDMMETMTAAQGVGIAAPQIAVSQQLFIVSSKPNARYPHAPHMEPTVVINPILEWASDEKVKDWEGCLSIPGLRALVPRHKTIKVRYIDGQTLKEVSAEYVDFIARVWQHEFDHINGVVFPDRVESSKDYITDREYKKLIAARTPQ
jgi:peptide deformylase